MNVESGTEAAQFREKEFINGIFVAVCVLQQSYVLCFTRGRLHKVIYKMLYLLHIF
jgi:hypothetical protein